MPMGTRHTVTGILRRSRYGLYALEVDGGGVWQLDCGWGWKARKLVGQKVTVEGTRGGFDLLFVDMLWLGGSVGN
ncbi:DUF5818 domain-containing protein [Alterisphingorhabdus coralli]|uniref:DUF5818 domain-containing protein n=1 Tax=Alterisphingorhabdus coralli TaxID=3071408 RepID=A0AA97F5D7_9SPHN|nr:DUF5818 domain-containing protein [Parasphingorhabdus sp. SCSIO 66989]WOE74654.1 DUF5818 domain-containing protein [Parasphingorhabdus sp. SCSIO 66989]